MNFQRATRFVVVAENGETEIFETGRDAMAGATFAWAKQGPHPLQKRFGSVIDTFFRRARWSNS
jgi:hypothetical protein